MLNFLTTNERKNIIIFIHGFIGGKKTWMNGDEPRDFIKFIQQDEEITANFDFAYFDYFTKVTDILERASGILGLFGKKPKKKRNLEIGDISDLLTTEIDARLDAYERLYWLDIVWEDWSRSHTFLNRLTTIQSPRV